MQGPKIRIGTFKKTFVNLINNQKFDLDLNPEPEMKEEFYFLIQKYLNRLKKNTKVLIDDGKIILNIIGVYSDKISTEVINGGKISNMKGVNIPETFI